MAEQAICTRPEDSGFLKGSLKTRTEAGSGFDTDSGLILIRSLKNFSKAGISVSTIFSAKFTWRILSSSVGHPRISGSVEPTFFLLPSKSGRKRLLQHGELVKLPFFTLAITVTPALPLGPASSVLGPYI
jgi:hypothetical protein